MIRFKNISKIYENGNIRTKALTEISLNINAGEMVAVTGPSGSGKSTLLNIAGCMDYATDGELFINREKVNYSKTQELHRIRKENISFIFQQFALMERYDVFENIEMPLVARGINKRNRKVIVDENLEKLGIMDIAHKNVLDISGGQKQRVAIARALSCMTPIILADEPTGSLDRKNSWEVVEILSQLLKEGKTIVIITHDIEIAKKCTRIIEIEDGRIKNNERKG